MGQERGSIGITRWEIPTEAPGRAAQAATTWTLISLDELGRLVRVWHQHGEGTAPVRLDPEPVSTNAAPSVTARAFSCPECEALTVVSSPAPALS